MILLVKIKSYTLNLLARREHSQLELSRKLAAKGYPDDLINNLLQELASENLQSNARFTEEYIRMRANRGYGPLRIRMELCERGINQDMIDQFLNENDPEWQARAEIARQKKFGAAVPHDFKSRAQQLRFLQYRGFIVGATLAVAHLRSPP